MENNSILEILPLELITKHIMVRAAASSSDDLFNLRQSCKTLYEVSYDPCILRSVSLEKFHPVPWKQEEITFTERCSNAQNPEAMYRSGMMQYFGTAEGVSGIEYLQRAMDAGHQGAKYATGIILILQGGVHKLDGMQIVLSMKKSSLTTKIFKEVRESFLQTIKSMWIKNTLIVEQRMPQCCSRHTAKSAGWEELEDVDLQCQDCSCDQELVHLSKVLPS